MLRRKSCCLLRSSGISCVKESVSIMVGCLIVVPISSSFCTSCRLFTTASFAPLCSTGFSVDGAFEVSVFWDSVGWELLSDVLVVSLSIELVEVVSVSFCVGFNPLIGITGVSTTVTGAVTIGNALMTLTGLVMLVGLVIDFTHESETTTQSFHKG